MVASSHDYQTLLNNRGHWGIKCGLENSSQILKTLGSPQDTFKVVLIAGTNGKGSTGAFMANALLNCGIKTGWTTSPHLIAPTERIWLNGSHIDGAHFNRLLGKVFAAETKLGIQATYFELIIATAFLAFQEANIDIALVEVGMGGRWDATNVTDPILTVLTNVEIDHTEFLGCTREAIAKEKLCTARAKRPLIIGPSLNYTWLTSLLEDTPIVYPTPKLQADTIAWDHSVVNGHRINLAGKHQIDNLATAWAAIKHLQQLGFAIDTTKAWHGMANAIWPGRLWRVPGLANVFMDGAHNLNGATCLADHVRSCNLKPHLFFAAMGDKDLVGMKNQLSSIDPIQTTLVCGANPRYATPSTLRAIWGNDLEVIDIPTAASYLKTDSTNCRLVCGSLYFLGDLLMSLNIDPVK